MRVEGKGSFQNATGLKQFGKEMDFPAPFSPSSAWTSPPWRSNETPFNARTAPNEVNIGMPYKWGGFDDPASFDSAIANGLAAGDVSSLAKRRADSAAVSRQAAGVDCSGFVSRCLKLPAVHDTAQLPTICNVLPNAQELRPGDLLNIAHRHVILCAGWATPDHRWIYFYETGGAPDFWKPGLKRAPLDGLLARGYQPLRYRGMATETRTDGKEILTRAVRAASLVVANPTVGEP